MTTPTSWFEGLCSGCGYNIVGIRVDSTGKPLLPRPQADYPSSDFLYYCSNKQCKHHFGEVAGEGLPEWVVVHDPVSREILGLTGEFVARLNYNYGVKSC